MNSKFKLKNFLIIVLLTIIQNSTYANDIKAKQKNKNNQHNKISDECKKIKKACLEAGFIQGGSRDGKGLWAHCINPLMLNKPAENSKIDLPKIDEALIAACKAKQPKFGIHNEKKRDKKVKAKVKKNSGEYSEES